MPNNLGQESSKTSLNIQMKLHKFYKISFKLWWEKNGHIQGGQNHILYVYNDPPSPNNYSNRQKSYICLYFVFFILGNKLINVNIVKWNEVREVLN